MWSKNTALENQEGEFILDLNQPNDIYKEYIIKWSAFLCMYHHIFKDIAYKFLPEMWQSINKKCK